eukprot:scaffold44502_cov54-Attheya_sp.AAC.1
MVCTKNLPCRPPGFDGGTQPPGSGLDYRRLRRPLPLYPSSVRLSSFPTRTGVRTIKGRRRSNYRTKARAFLLGRDRSDRWTDDGYLGTLPSRRLP